MKKNKKALLFRNRELATHIDLQVRFIRDMEREIYENVNQVLCLARIKLNGIDLADKESTEQVIGQSDGLIVKAIHDLRNLAKQARNL